MGRRAVRAVFIRVPNCCERLGSVTDIHYEHLDDGKERASSKRERSELLPHVCGKCAFLKPPKVYAFIDLSRGQFPSGLHHEPLQKLLRDV